MTNTCSQNAKSGVKTVAYKKKEGQTNQGKLEKRTDKNMKERNFENVLLNDQDKIRLEI